MYTAEEVAGKLIAMARKKTPDLFILETKGILIGSGSSYAEKLSKFKNLHVRVSLKGT